MLNPFFYVQAVLLALSQIWVNKTRSFLTALGIIIGVASVTSVIAVLSGMKTKILSEFESFGASKMFIFPDRPDDAPRNKYPWSAVRLKPTELVAIRDNCPSVANLTPITNIGQTVQYESEIREVNITGIWPDWHIIESRDILKGRPFTRFDEDNAKQVCLVNDKAVLELRLNDDPTGDHILIGGRRFQIVGVVETIQSGLFGPSTTQTEVYIPFSTAVRLQNEDDYFFYIICKVKSPDVSEEAKAEATFVLRHARQLGPDEPQTFSVEAIDQFIAQFKAIAAGITAVAGGIVGISLLVGGIGIMNIMLVSVSERTREIGLRKAVGATPSAILMQFLLEAVTLCFVGGLIGVLIGEGFAFGVSKIPDANLEVAVPWWAVIMSFGFSAFVGVVFGMFPAVKAARLDPIDALRHE